MIVPLATQSLPGCKPASSSRPSRSIVRCHASRKSLLPMAAVEHQRSGISKATASMASAACGLALAASLCLPGRVQGAKNSVQVAGCFAERRFNVQRGWDVCWLCGPATVVGTSLALFEKQIELGSYGSQCHVPINTGFQSWVKMSTCAKTKASIGPTRVSIVDLSGCSDFRLKIYFTFHLHLDLKLSPFCAAFASLFPCICLALPFQGFPWPAPREWTDQTCYPRNKPLWLMWQDFWLPQRYGCSLVDAGACQTIIRIVLQSWLASHGSFIAPGSKNTGWNREFGGWYWLPAAGACPELPRDTR